MNFQGAPHNRTVKHDCLCVHCEETFISRAHLKRHVEQVHKKIKNYKCSQCDYNVYLKCTLKRHVSIVHEKTRNFQCTHCDRAFSLKGNLVKHVDQVHSKIKRYNCSKCEFKSYHRNVMKKHEFKAHSVQKNLQSEAFHITSNLTQHGDAVNDKETKFNCSQCDFKSNYQRKVKLHEATVHNIGKTFLCKPCNKEYTSKAGLSIHIKIAHKGETEFQCPQFQYQVHEDSPSVRNISDIQGKIKNFLCKFCSKSFTLKCNLYKHVANVHRKITKYDCSQCEYKTYYKYNMKKHISRNHNENMTKTNLKIKKIKDNPSEELDTFNSSKQENKESQEMMKIECNPTVQEESDINNFKTIDSKLAKDWNKGFKCYKCNFFAEDLLQFVGHLDSKHMINENCRKKNSLSGVTHRVFYETVEKGVKTEGEEESHDVIKKPDDDVSIKDYDLANKAIEEKIKLEEVTFHDGRNEPIVQTHFKNQDTRNGHVYDTAEDLIKSEENEFQYGIKLTKEVRINIWTYKCLACGIKFASKEHKKVHKCSEYLITKKEGVQCSMKE